MQSPSAHNVRAFSLKRATICVALAASVFGCLPTLAAAQSDKVSFDMVAPASVATCLPDATARVTIDTVGDNQRMQVQVKGLAPNADFTLFVLQIPRFPFGMAWYQGEIHTGAGGTGTHQFIGVFSSETHVLAVGNPAPAPQTDPGIDAVTNPTTAPVHMYHLGIWFSDPADAVAAGCSGAVTPFDGDHVAGILVLNTSNFPDLEGPLGQLQ
jgi:hypothetical protein